MTIKGREEGGIKKRKMNVVALTPQITSVRLLNYMDVGIIVVSH